MGSPTFGEGHVNVLEFDLWARRREQHGEQLLYTFSRQSGRKAMH